MNKSILSILFVVFISCNSNQEKQVPGNTLPEPASSTQNNYVLSIKIFNNDTLKSNDGSTGFGYDIYNGNALYIHQPHIPAVAGNRGFSTAEIAYKTASLAVYKIQNNILPPAISTHELDSLGALK